MDSPSKLERPLDCAGRNEHEDGSASREGPLEPASLHEMLLVNPVLVSALRNVNASQQLRKEREVILAAINGDDGGSKLQYAAPELRNDKEIVLLAVSKLGYALQHASRELRSDKEVVMAACAQCGFAIRYASRELRGDLDVCELAVAGSGVRTMRFFTTDMRGDRDVVMAMAKTDGHALKYASESLLSDSAFVLEAAATNIRALEYAAPTLKATKSFRKAARKLIAEHKEAEEKNRQDQIKEEAERNKALEKIEASKLKSAAKNGAAQLHAEAEITDEIISAPIIEAEEYVQPVAAETAAISGFPSELPSASSEESTADVTTLATPPEQTKLPIAPDPEPMEESQADSHALETPSKAKGKSSSALFKTVKLTTDSSAASRDESTPISTTDKSMEDSSELVSAHKGSNTPTSNLDLVLTTPDKESPAVKSPSEALAPLSDAAEVATPFQQQHDAPSAAQQPTAAGLLSIAAFGGNKGSATAFGAMDLTTKLGSSKGHLGVLKMAAKLKAKAIDVHRHTPLADAPPHARHDHDFVLAAVRRAGLSLKFASPELRSDRSIVKAACAQNGDAFRYADMSLREDRAFVLDCCKSGGMAVSSCVAFLSSDLREDRSFWEAVLAVNPACMCRAPPAIRSDKELVLQTVTKRGQELQSAYTLWDDIEVVLAAIRQDPLALEHASPAMCGHRDVVAAALEVDGLALKFASDELRDDNAMICLATQQKWWAIGHASPRALLEAGGTDRDLLDALIASFHKSLGIVKIKYRSLQTGPPPPLVSPSGEPPIGTPGALELLRVRLATSNSTNNRAFMIKVMEVDGRALKWAHPRLRKDLQTCKKAVRQAGVGAIPYVHESLRSDRDFMLMAIECDGRCLKYVGADWMHRDLDFIATAGDEIKDREEDRREKLLEASNTNKTSLPTADVAESASLKS